MLKKTKEIIFKNVNYVNRELEVSISVDGVDVQPSDCIKYLGVFIDNKLRFEFQTVHLLKLIKSKLFLSRALFKSCRKQIIVKDFVLTSFLPCILYACHVYIHFLSRT
jgi:hypothetical protein